MRAPIRGAAPCVRLGDSVAMRERMPEGTRRAMYRDGLAFERVDGAADRPYTRVSVPPVVLRAPLAPVAALIDSMTGGSGEAIALAFRGRPHVRTFGTARAAHPRPPAGAGPCRTAPAWAGPRRRWKPQS